MKRIICALVISLSACSPEPEKTVEINKLTYHNNPQRTGWNASEAILTPETVSGDSFGLIWQTPQFDSFDGKPPRLFASPLYVDEVEMLAGEYQGQTFPVLYVVTNTGYVYAVSAFETGDTPPGVIIWRRRLTDQPCFKGVIGNLSTPVIDLEKQRLYVTSCDAEEQWQAYALDIRSGETIAGWPVSLGHSALNTPGINKNGGTQFPETIKHFQRGALNLSPDGSRLYIPFGFDLESGWIAALDTFNAKVATAFSTTALTEEKQGGMWASGGPSIDAEGRIYIATGSSYFSTTEKAGIAGVFPESKHNWGQSIIQLSDFSDNGFKLTGTYSPFNYCQTAAADIDLGSSGTIVISLEPSTTSTPHLLALIGGKQGNAYLLDRARMPGSLTKRQPCSSDSTTDLSLLSPDNQPQFAQPGPINIFGPYSDDHGWFDQAKSRSTGAYFRDSEGVSYLFGTGSGKLEEASSVSVPPGLVRLKIVTSSGEPAYLQIAQSEQITTFENPGSPVLSSNGGKDAIVWVLDANAPRTTLLWGPKAPRPVLYAFDALSFKLLWKSEPGELFTSGKYNEPTIVRGAVFVGTDRIQAFGLRDSPLAGEPAENQGFKPLFDGKTLKDWRGDLTLWSVEDGAITGKSDTPTRINTFLIHKEKFRNFELRLKYRFLTKQGNSGFQYRSMPLPEKAFSVTGYQANIVTPDAGERFGMLWDEHARGLLAYLGEKVEITEGLDGIDRKVTGLLNDPEVILKAVKPYPAWNDYVVIAYENRLIHVVNGFLAVDVSDNDVNGRAMEGVFALQLHAGSPMGIQVKYIEVRELTTEPTIVGRFVTSPVALAPTPPQKEVESTSTPDGEAIYLKRCAVCHYTGRDGVPPRDKIAAHPHNYIVNVLTSGSMQAMAFELSIAEINAVVTYLSQTLGSPD